MGAFLDQNYDVRYKWGSSCSKAVEYTPVKQNSWGHGFESWQALGFFLFISILSAVRP